MPKKKVIQNRVMDVDELVPYLEDVIMGIKDGTLTVDQGDEYISFTTPEQIEISLKARQTHKKESYSLKVHWVSKLTEKEADEKFQDYIEPTPEEKAEKATKPVVNVVEEEKPVKDIPAPKRPVEPSFHQRRQSEVVTDEQPPASAKEEASVSEAQEAETPKSDIPPLEYVDGPDLKTPVLDDCISESSADTSDNATELQSVQPEVEDTEADDKVELDTEPQDKSATEKSPADKSEGTFVLGGEKSE